MKVGSKYYPLHQHLQQCEQETVSLSFDEIESLMGSSLPTSARKCKNWWSNRDSPNALQAGAWMQAGYHVQQVDLEQQVVIFQKVQTQDIIQRQDGEINWTGEAIRALRKHKGLNQEEFATELGVRREAISTWENGKYTPDRTKCKLLNYIAKEAGFGR